MDFFTTWTWESTLINAAIKAVMPLLLDADPEFTDHARQCVQVRITDSEVSFAFDHRFVEAAATWEPPMQATMPGTVTTYMILGEGSDWKNWGAYAGPQSPHPPAPSAFFHPGGPYDDPVEDEDPDPLGATLTGFMHGYIEGLPKSGDHPQAEQQFMVDEEFVEWSGEYDDEGHKVWVLTAEGRAWCEEKGIGAQREGDDERP